jgi:uncharacterized RDD family membrane protein YckC
MVSDPAVVTGEAVALELRTAGAGSRGIAAAIDFAVVVALLIVPLLLVGELGGSADSATEAALLLIVYVGVVLGYPVAMETLWHGRTLGKAAMGLRVVRDDGGPIRFRHAFVRGLIGVVIDRPGISVSVLAFVPMLATARNKRLGDVFAGTIVLSERVPGAIDVAVPMPRQLAGWAAGLDLSTVDDGLAMRARQLLLRAGQLSPTAVATLQREVAVELVARVGAPPDGAPDWAVLSAVVAERRGRTLAAAHRPTPAAAPRPVPIPGPAPAPVTPAPVTPASQTQPPPPAAGGGGFAPPA